ncbi:hypothetical protein [Pseudonocardia autotrophica]|nr:hypothetical protein [Pseudonocardia autotrophica]BBF99151.1 hypothetical protein Pdca_03610 [Pseudonocardia autotrophica]
MVPVAVARGVVDGSVDRAYRRWARPRVRAGATQRTAAGVLAIVAVTEIDPATITDADAVAAGAASADALRRAFRGTAADPVFRIDLRPGGPDPRTALSRDDVLSGDDRAAITARLDRLDRASRSGPWTRATLHVIAEHPGRRAAELADLLGRERDPFKLDVRKLKNLGLTESLEVGYRLSPRGVAYRDTGDRSTHRSTAPGEATGPGSADAGAG